MDLINIFEALFGNEFMKEYFKSVGQALFTVKHVQRDNLQGRREGGPGATSRYKAHYPSQCDNLQM